MSTDKNNMSTKVKGFSLALLAGLLWGVNGVVGQYLFSEKGITATWLVCYRLIFAGMILLVYLKCRKVECTSIWKNKADGGRMLIYSVLGMMMVQFTFFRAVETSNAGTATVLQYLNPAMMLIYFTVKRRVLPAWKEVVIILVALIGTFFVATGGNINTLTLSVEGLFWGLVCAVVTCVYSILPIKILRKYDARVICGWGMLIGGIVLTIISRPWTIQTTVDGTVVGMMMFVVIFGTIIPYSCSLMTLPMIGPINSNLVSSVEPVVSAIIAFLVLGTLFSAGEVVGFALIIGTVVVLALWDE